MSDEQPQEPEYLDPGEMDAQDRQDWHRIQRSRPAARPRRAFTIGQLIQMYNAQLGWTNLKLAEELGMNDGQVARLINDHYKRPHIATLQRLVDVYNRAGLLDVTIETFLTSRDTGGSENNWFNVPDHWQRLIYQVLAEGTEYADMMFRKWSLDNRETSTLLRKKQSPEDES